MMIDFTEITEMFIIVGGFLTLLFTTIILVNWIIEKIKSKFKK